MCVCVCARVQLFPHLLFNAVKMLNSHTKLCIRHLCVYKREYPYFLDVEVKCGSHRQNCMRDVHVDRSVPEKYALCVLELALTLDHLVRLEPMEPNLMRHSHSSREGRRGRVGAGDTQAELACG